ncbi:MAG: hypothetical protein KJ793_02405 [Candidatus Omnitrophica bacterium]|nr:hypothetical protein [Candidatus Omnitrophota bacterium]
MRLDFKTKSLVVILLLCLLLGSYNLGYAGGDAAMYSRAIAVAKAGNVGAAFMYFHSLLTRYPDSQYREEALFALGEYYFLTSNSSDAVSNFVALVDEFPDFEGKIFALVYLFKIAERANEKSMAQGLEKDIVTFKRLILLFKDYKEYKYLSPLHREHKLVYFIDKIEAYVDGELLAQIPY